MIATIARRTRFFLLCVLIAGAVAAVSWYQQQHPGETIAGSVRVIDGDSLVVNEIEVRLFGIDAPELYQTCTRDQREWNCGSEARRTLRAMVAGRTVECRPRAQDRFGRSVAVCRVGDLDLGAAMIRGGFAVSYGAYEAEEREARDARRGIWASTFDPPAKWRARNPRRGSRLTLGARA